MPGIMEVRKELFLSFERLKASLTQEVEGSRMKAHLQKVRGRKRSECARAPRPS
jgi:hypothetical protein